MLRAVGRILVVVLAAGVLSGTSWGQSFRVAPPSTIEAPAKPSPQLQAELKRLKLDPKATELAKQIKRKAVYLEPDRRESSWLGTALGRLKNLKFDWPWKDDKEVKQPDFSFLGLQALGSFVTVTMWVLLAAAVAVFLAFAIRHAMWKADLRRRAKTLLEDDEPERTEDEWLAEAERLTQAGRYREAVRGLYLACLLRFDEARIARFDRSQTNWEHLSRIQKSPLLPVGLDFLAPTRLFDVVWYGNRVRGLADVEEMKSMYGEVVARLSGRVAA